MPHPKSMMVFSLSLESWGRISWINSRNRLIWRNLSYRELTIFPSPVITPKSTRKGTGRPSSKIYAFLRLWERRSCRLRPSFHCPAKAAPASRASFSFPPIFVLTVIFPFLLTSTCPQPFSDKSSHRQKSCSKRAVNKAAPSSLDKFLWNAWRPVNSSSWNTKLPFKYKGRTLAFVKPDELTGLLKIIWLSPSSKNKAQSSFRLCRSFSSISLPP